MADPTGTHDNNYNQGPQEFLRTLPGISSKNYRYVAKEVDNVESLCSMSIQAISALIGQERGRELHTFLTQNTHQNAD